MKRILLDETHIPKQWYNIQADLQNPLDPPLNPRTQEPIGPSDLSAIFPMGLIKQEVSQDRYITIPEEVREIYRMWRPTPLIRADRLEKALKTPAKIYYKWEGVSPPGSHKPNSAVAQAYYNKQEGVERLVTETGAGQWGSALAFSTRLFDMQCRIYMVKCSYEQKPYRRVLMENWGAEVFPSPTELTEVGKEIRKKDPNTSGSLGIAISEAVEEAAKNENSNYALGSVLNHVVLHQTVIGEEMQEQFKMIDDYPDVIVGCVGGGSNFAGTAFPFVRDKISGEKPDVQIVSVEPLACPTLTKGPFVYDLGDFSGMTPLLPMYSLGHNFVPPPIHAGGLRYHGMAPLVSQAVVEGLLTPRAIHQLECYDAAVLFARTEGIIIAPETSHAVAAAIQEANKAKEEGKEKVILFNMSGHGLMDLTGYQAFFDGKLHDYEFPKAQIDQNLEVIKDFPKPEVVKSGKW